MYYLGIIEQNHVCDEYELADILGNFFPRVEVEEGESRAYEPNRPLGKVAHLGGSDAFESMLEGAVLPADDPATAADLEDADVPALFISSRGIAHIASNLADPLEDLDFMREYEPRGGWKYHVFAFEA